MVGWSDGRKLLTWAPSLPFQAVSGRSDLVFDPLRVANPLWTFWTFSGPMSKRSRKKTTVFMRRNYIFWTFWTFWTFLAVPAQPRFPVFLVYRGRLPKRE